VQRLVISRMQARTYQERLSQAAEVAQAATNGTAQNGAKAAREPATAGS
jgi:hypothetical protein